MNDDLLLEIRDLRISIEENKEMIPVIKGVDISIPKGSIVGLVGESGCGKSMTARAINGILPLSARVTGGSILWHEQGEVCDLLTLREKELRKLCGTKISMVFQEPMTSLDPMMRVGDQITEVMKIHGLEDDRKKAKEKAVRMLEAVGIPEPEQRYRSRPHELSGGMRQRVMIAMAMTGSPSLLIADEATTALDVTTQAQILDLIRDMCRRYSMSALIISHNMGVISSICDRVYVMYLGTIMETASVKELFKNPLHPYTRGLLSSIPGLGENKEYLTTIPGNIMNTKPGFPGCDFCTRCSDDMRKCFFEKPMLEYAADDHYVRCHAVHEGVKGSDGK